MSPGSRQAGVRRSLAHASLLILLAAGCAPIGHYHGITPAPGSPQPTGDLRSGPDSTVVIVYGDNRPGQMVLSRSYGVPVVRSAFRSHNAGDWLRGVIHVPIALLQLVFPTLDGVRDIWSKFGSHRFTGGNEVGVLRSISNEVDADLVVNTGDLVEDGRRGGQWNDFARRHGALRESVDFVAAPGNHERTWDDFGKRNWEAVVGAPSGPGRYWHAVDIGRARFVILDSNLLADPGRQYPDAEEAALAEAQLAWADSALAEDFPYKFVALHHPLVSSGHHIDDWRDDDLRGGSSRRMRLIQMGHRHGVVAVLAGHEHLYESTWISSADGRSGFWHVTTGGGGSPLYRITDERRRMALAQTLPGGSRITFPAEQQSVYHYCRLIVPGSEAPDDDGAGVFLRVQRVDGNHVTRVIDTIDLSRPPGTHPTGEPR